MVIVVSKWPTLFSDPCSWKTRVSKRDCVVVMGSSTYLPPMLYVPLCGGLSCFVFLWLSVDDDGVTILNFLLVKQRDSTPYTKLTP